MPVVPDKGETIMSGESSGNQNESWSMSVSVRGATDADRPGILTVHRRAFPDESVADLTADLFSDPSAHPMTSLVAVADGKLVGHVLFTAAALQPETGGRVSLLAPLGVVPEYQRQGIGQKLVFAGLAILARSGTSIVFVLGHPAYYPRFGFITAGERGFAAPYPIPERNADAWMVLALNGAIPASYTGTVRCANALNRPEHWRE
jgi:predicted N-acetyltransferase YhbS